MVNLTAASSGTDADWVVKLIDVYPDQVAGDHAMGGYQLAIAMDIFRGRYRTSLAKAAPITANAALPYRFALPKIGRATCRERVCQYVYISVVAVSLKKKKT